MLLAAGLSNLRVDLLCGLRMQGEADVVLREAAALLHCAAATLQALYAVAEPSGTQRDLEAMLTG
jgi:hypothetical protein